MKYILFFLSLLMCPLLLAMPSAQIKPNACPSVSEIQNAGFSFVGKECGTDNWVALQIDRYGTQESWEFYVGNISATSEDDAKQKAKDALLTLSGGSGPSYVPEYNKWKCMYDIGSGYIAAAYTVGPLYKIKNHHCQQTPGFF